MANILQINLPISSIPYGQIGKKVESVTTPSISESNPAPTLRFQLLQAVPSCEGPTSSLRPIQTPVTSLNDVTSKRQPFSGLRDDACTVERAAMVTIVERTLFGVVMRRPVVIVYF